MILALAVIGLAWHLPDLNAQAPVQPQGQAAAPAGPPQLPPTVANMKGKTAGQFYKNVKVLNNIPADEILPVMEYFITALGVGCPYCHTIGKFDLDDKREKKVARNMMKMTLALNSTVFDGKREITCFTCHRGLPKGAPTFVFPGEKAPAEPTAAEIFPTVPVRNITIDSTMAPEPPAPPAPPKPGAPAPAPLPAADDVFGKYTQALGGKAAIGKITSLVEKGTVDMLVPPPPTPPGAPPGPPPAMGTVPAESYHKAPNKGVLSVQFPGRGPTMVGYDGDIGWHNTPIREDTGGELVLVQEMAELFPALNFKDDHKNVQVDATEKIGGRDVYRVVGARRDGSTIDRVYFDAQTGLLVRSYTTMQSSLGAFPEETTFEDYRDVSGVKVPFTIHLASPEGDRTYKWAQVDANASVEDAKFTKPLPPPPPPSSPTNLQVR